MQAGSVVVPDLEMMFTETLFPSQSSNNSFKADGLMELPAK